jgi:hypothetical protein
MHDCILRWLAYLPTQSIAFEFAKGCFAAVDPVNPERQWHECPNDGMADMARTEEGDRMDG